MTHKKIVLATFVFALLGVTACSSSFGTDTPPPRDHTTVVVPENNSAPPSSR